MKIKDLVKEFKDHKNWKLVCECVGRSSFGMKPGDKYEELCSVYQIKRVRRQWEEPGQEIIFECISKEIPSKGYLSIYTSQLKDAVIEKNSDFIRIKYGNDRNVYRDYYKV